MSAIDGGGDVSEFAALAQAAKDTRVTKEEIASERETRLQIFKAEPSMYRYAINTELAHPVAMLVRKVNPQCHALHTWSTILGFSTLLSGIIAVVFLAMGQYVAAIAAFAISFLVLNQIQTSVNYELLGRVDAVMAKLIEREGIGKWL